MRITAGRVVMALGLAAALAGVPGSDAAAGAGRDRGRRQGTLCRQHRRGWQDARPRALCGRRAARRALDARALKSGDNVAADDVIATIMPPAAPLLDPRSRREAEERLGTAEAARERSKATVERAKAQADQAKTDLGRARTLAAQGASTVQALERAELVQRVADRDLRAAEFQDHAAAHEVDQAKALLARYQDARTHRSNAGTSQRRYRAWC